MDHEWFCACHEVDRSLTVNKDHSGSFKSISRQSIGASAKAWNGIAISIGIVSNSMWNRHRNENWFGCLKILFWFLINVSELNRAFQENLWLTKNDLKTLLFVSEKKSLKKV